RAPISLCASVVTHHAQVPAAAPLVIVTALTAPGSPARRLREAAVLLVGAAALASFWSLPLLLRLDHTRALAWGRVTIGDVGSLLARHPLLPLIVLLALPLAGDPRSPVRILQRLPWATALVVAGGA